mgnify:CR=1 FL=1
MNTITLFSQVSQKCSRVVTESYSTSFSSAINLLHPSMRTPVYAIYGFVRLADEIVDTFHDHEKELLLSEFKEHTFQAIDRKISLNPILQAFQQTVNTYMISEELITAFFRSMEMDLEKTIYKTADELREYIYGSAEVVGLMCLYVFCNGNHAQYEQLKHTAQALGAAFQKVNFLRDLKADIQGLNRAYFPDFDLANFNATTKSVIEADIAADFKMAREGIRLLPSQAKFGVFVAYKYYLSLFNKIKRLDSTVIMEKRVRIPNFNKVMIVLIASVENKMNVLID